MARTLQEIADEINEAVNVIIDTNMDAAAQMTGSPRSQERAKLGVKLADGREVDLGALAEELNAAVAERDQ